MKLALAGWLLAAAWAFGTGLAAAATQTNDAPAAYRRGYQLLEQAERATTTTERQQNLSAAREQFATALALDPHHDRARALLAQTLFGLMRETPDDALALDLARQADQHFAQAANQRAGDWRILSSWGRFLTYCAQRLAPNAAERCAQLHQARQLFNQAHALTRTTLDKSRVAGTRGECLWEIAQCDPADDVRRQALEACLQDFATAHQYQPAFLTASQLRTWGRALLAVGRITTNRIQLASATTRLDEALMLEPDSGLAHYELARAYTLLGNTNAAWSHLRQAVQMRGAADVIERARAEPDLAPLSGQPEFATLLRPQPTGTLASRLAEVEHLLTQTGQVTAAHVYRRALALLEPLVTEYPTTYRVHELRATVLAALATNALTQTERRQLWQQAQTACQIAARLPEHEAKLYLVWGGLWLPQAAPPVAPLEAYRQATQLFETGWKRTAHAGERRRLQHALAGALIGYGILAANAPDRESCLQRATQLLEELARTPSGERDAMLYRWWGQALTALGQITLERLAYRQAIEKFLTALELEPTNLGARYELVVAYALSGQPTQALRHLEHCCAADPSGAYRRRAAQDPNLHSLRRYPGFNRLIGETVP